MGSSIVADPASCVPGMKISFKENLSKYSHDLQRIIVITDVDQVLIFNQCNAPKLHSSPRVHLFQSVIPQQMLLKPKVQLSLFVIPCQFWLRH